MQRDYTKQIAEFWPTIMRAWNDYADKRPVIECDVVKRQVLAWSAHEYISGLSERTREVTRRQFQRATAAGGIMVFIRDSRNRVLQSHVYVPDDTCEPKPNKTVHLTGASRSASGTGRTPGAAGSCR
jgi:hypothetical protein